ncbi:MAG: hypothetical protein JNL63_06940 [Bacteroidia bacterium]|nr:hypothetical protein [Bacteroidia bacterium]
MLKRKLLTGSLIIGTLFVHAQRQASNEGKEDKGGEKYGNTLNMSLGFSYGYGYYGDSFPFLINYEFDVAKNFTLAPFISFFSYTNYYYWGSPGNNKPYRDYSYRTVVIPIGLKGAYYFDELLLAGEKWDFYGAASLGFAYRKTTWEDGYTGSTNAVKRTNSGGYMDIHVGAEYHFNPKIGMFLDMSTGVSSFGISIKTR